MTLVSEHVSVFEPHGNSVAGKQNVVQRSSDIHIFAPFRIDLTSLLSDDPSSGFVFLFENPDEDGCEFDFVLTVILPF